MDADAQKWLQVRFLLPGLGFKGFLSFRFLGFLSNCVTFNSTA